MKADIHPQYSATTVTCSCGNTFTTRSTAPGGSIHVEVCSNCHPFYTGKQKILDTGGRVARFEKRFGKNAVRPEGRPEVASRAGIQRPWISALPRPCPAALTIPSRDPRRTAAFPWLWIRAYRAVISRPVQ